MIKRQSPWGLWHRCKQCGTLFSDKQELREHLTTHKFNRPTVPARPGSVEPMDDHAPAHPYREPQPAKFVSQ